MIKLLLCKFSNFSSDWDVFSDDNDDLSRPSSSEDDEYETSENDGSQNGWWWKRDREYNHRLFSGGHASVKKYLNTNPKQIQREDCYMDSKELQTFRNS